MCLNLSPWMESYKPQVGQRKRPAAASRMAGGSVLIHVSAKKSKAGPLASGGPSGLCGQRLPELDLISIQVIDPGKAAVGFIQSFGVDLYSLLF